MLLFSHFFTLFWHIFVTFSHFQSKITFFMFIFMHLYDNYALFLPLFLNFDEYLVYFASLYYRIFLYRKYTILFTPNIDFSMDSPILICLCGIASRRSGGCFAHYWAHRPLFMINCRIFIIYGRLSPVFSFFGPNLCTFFNQKYLFFRIFMLNLPYFLVF